VGDGAETTHAGYDDVKAAFATSNHLARYRFARGHRLVELLLELCLEGQPTGDTNFLPRRDHHDLDRIARTEIIDLRPVEYRFGLSRNVDQRDIAFNGDNRSFNDIADLEGFGFKTLAQRLFELVHVIGFFAHGRPRTQKSAQQYTGGGRIAHMSFKF